MPERLLARGCQESEVTDLSYMVDRTQIFYEMYGVDAGLAQKYWGFVRRSFIREYGFGPDEFGALESAAEATICAFYDEIRVLV